jgi:hypothetical protein
MNVADTDAERKLLRISEIVARQLTGEARPEIHQDGKERVTQVIAEKRLRRRRPRLLWAVALAALSSALLGAGYWLYSSGRPLDYTVLGGFVSEGGYVNSDGVAARASLRFSDGSEVSFAEGAQGRVTALSSRGARIALENGRASLRLADRPNTVWVVDSGPFVIRGTASEFDVDWSGVEGTLEVELRGGSVVVSGPPAPGGLLLRPGQRLVAQQGHLRVEATSALDGSPAPDTQLELTRNTGVAQAPDLAAEPDPALIPSWTARVGAGEHLAVLAEAEERGLESCYAESSLADLVALADAARSASRSDIARRALLSQRSRFASSGAAHTAAFLLGRLAEDAGGTEATAIDWYDRYLKEAPDGPLAAEALGRKLLILKSVERIEDARATARDYLERYPTGPYAPEAHELTGRPSP